MRKLKRINEDSNIYKIVREGIGFASYLGGAAALDCTVMPWVWAVLGGKKSRFLRNMAWLGTLGLSNVVGAYAREGIDEMIDVYVKAWNILPFVEKEDACEEPITNWFAKDESAQEKTEIEKDNVAYSDISYSEWDTIHDDVIKYRLFEFKSEDDAKAAFRFMKWCIENHDYATFSDYIGFRNCRDTDSFKLNSAEIPYSNFVGWNKDCIIDAIDKVRDDLYVLDAFTYTWVGVQTLNDLDISDKQKRDFYYGKNGTVKE